MRVLVLGAGYAGVVVTRTLEPRLPAETELVVVDESPHHLVQHELHRVVRDPAIADAITVPLSDLFDEATVQQGTVVDVDTGAQSVELADGERLDYDAAAVCLGAQTNFYGMDDLAKHAYVLKQLEDAESIRETALDAFEGDHPRFVVGGAGLAGVQLAGELAAFADAKTVAVDVVLLEQADRVAPTFDEQFSRAVERALLERGVTVRTGAPVSGATTEHVQLASGETLPYELLVWTGGIRGPDAVQGERPTVRATLALDDRTFAVGDTARVVDSDGEAVPASAQAAVGEARVAAENILRIVHDEDDGFQPRLNRFTFDSPGWLVSVGDDAVAQVGSTVVRGQAAKALKTGVGARYLAATSGVDDALRLVRGEYVGERSDSDAGRR